MTGKQGLNPLAPSTPSKEQGSAVPAHSPVCPMEHSPWHRGKGYTTAIGQLAPVQGSEIGGL